jgi:hypothetical protein
MLYTVMPLEMVLDGNETFQPTYTEIPLKNGGTLLVEETGQKTAKVVRLISSDPMDYLNPVIQPGSIINYQTTFQA